MLNETFTKSLVEQDGIDPRVLRTRTLIEGAFTALMQEKSFQSISVSDITSRATINRATFYAHFQDKYDLFEFVVAKSFQELLRSRLNETCRFSTDNLHILILAVREYLSSHMSCCTLGMQQFHPSVFRQVQAQIFSLACHWLEGMEVEANVEATAAMLSWAVLGAGIHGNEKEEMDVTQIVKFLMKGLTGMGYVLD